MAVISRGFGARRRESDPRLPPGQYLTEDFPVLSAGPTPRIDTGEWRFGIRDEAGGVVSWTWEEFLALPIEDVHTIPGRGTVVTGRIERGTVKVGDAVEIVGLDNEAEVVVTGTQSFHKDVPEARAGMNVGLLLRGLKRDDVERGQVLSAPGAIRARSSGRATIFVLSKEEGGRHTPFAGGYAPQFFFGATNVTGTIRLDEGRSIAPGDQAEIGFELAKPVGIEPGVRFAMREGGRTVGAGIVTGIDG